jgi:hypothetical protein
MESVTAEMFNLMATIALFCILAVGGWALCSLACSVRDAVGRIAGRRNKR